MKTINKTIVTPRATIKAKIEFKDIEEASENGWGVWFQHERWIILGKDNRSGAVVRAS